MSETTTCKCGSEAVVLSRWCATCAGLLIRGLDAMAERWCGDMDSEGEDEEAADGRNLVRIMRLDPRLLKFDDDELVPEKPSAAPAKP